MTIIFQNLRCSQLYQRGKFNRPILHAIIKLRKIKQTYFTTFLCSFKILKHTISLQVRYQCLKFYLVIRRTILQVHLRIFLISKSVNNSLYCDLFAITSIYSLPDDTVCLAKKQWKLFWLFMVKITPCPIFLPTL